MWIDQQTPWRPVAIPHLREIEAADVVSQCSPFDIRVTVDATDVHSCCDSPVRLTVFAYADREGGGLRQRVGVRKRKVHAPVVTLAVRIEPKALPPGVYRLEAAATLECAGKDALLGRVLGCAFKEGGRLRVIA